jgi:squalene-hopene/tetraprenyl-beta-curcumene cyclase
MWTLQKKDGGIDWIHVKEAPQAIDDWWPAAVMALGAATAPERYAETPLAKAGIEKLRSWFRANPPKDHHQRAMTLLAHSAIGGIASDDERRAYIEAIFAAQHPDGGWSMVDLADWQRRDGKPLDASLTSGYPTGLLTYVLARSGVAPNEPRLRKAIQWLKTNQRRTGGWFTQSPFKRDKLASNTGASLAVQALAACGEIPKPKVTAEQFAEAHAIAEKAVPAGVYTPNPADEPYATR